jgi:hypothetical protein
MFHFKSSQFRGNLVAESERKLIFDSISLLAGRCSRAACFDLFHEVLSSPAGRKDLGRHFVVDLAGGNPRPSC